MIKEMKTERMANWDLLRSMSMFLVLVIHSTAMLGSVFHGDRIPTAINETLLVCDPVFFCLSGYFAIRPLKGTYSNYLLKKIRTVILPLIIYIFPLYFVQILLGESISIKAFVEFHHDYLFGGWWFIPELIPFLIIAPILYQMLEKLADRYIRAAFLIVAVLSLWGSLSTFVEQIFARCQMPVKATAVESLTRLLPTSVIPGSRYFIYFILGYFVRRIGPLRKQRYYTAVVAGVMAVVLSCLSAIFDFRRDDPNPLWVFSTLAIFEIFNYVNIRGIRSRWLLSWAARRSYSIYLIQYTVISCVSKYIGIFNYIISAGWGPFPSTVAWFIQVVLAYAISLLVASILDSTILRWSQYLLDQVVNVDASARHKRQQAL